MTDGAASGLLKVQGSSRLAFGATTAALVTLASTGTAVLVKQATDTTATPTSLPPGALPLAPAPDATPVVVDHPVGQQAAPAVDPTEKALRDALAQRPEPGRRTLTVPLVPVDVPPVVEPVLPPVVTPPVVTPPVLRPPSVVTPPATPAVTNHGGNTPNGAAHGIGDRPAKGIHSAKKAEPTKAHAGRALAKGQGKHALTKGRHAR